MHSAINVVRPLGGIKVKMIGLGIGVLLCAGGVVAMAVGAEGEGEGEMAVPGHAGGIWPDDRGVHINAHGGGLLLHEGVYYWFGEHKVAGRRGNSAQVGVHCYASDDLRTWTDRGIALAVSEDPESPIRRGCVIERPKVIHHRETGEFVMWFHLELRGRGYDAALTGVAVSDSPTGPYRFLRALRPNAGQWPHGFPETARIPADPAEIPEAWTPAWVRQVREGILTRRDFEGGQMSRDMTLYVDDDGTAYHIHSAEENMTLHVSELAPDFRSFTGLYTRVLPGDQNEAPALFKHDGRYYLLSSGCTGWAPNAARMAVADHILGPYTPLGNPCRGTNPANEMGPELTFGAQSTFAFPAPDQPGLFIAMFDIWQPRNPIDGRYLWLPIRFQDNKPVIEWTAEWPVGRWVGGSEVGR